MLPALLPLLMALEINYYRVMYPTTNIADFRNCKNPSIPVLQSATNINAPPNSLYTNYMYKKLKSA
jgi:hypothetical protein